MDSTRANSGDFGPLEIWRDVVGREGKYIVSNWGRVRSLARPVCCISGGKWTFRYIAPRVLAVCKNKSGHLQVKMGRGFPVQRVHTLVAAAFIGRRPEGMDVAHLDGNPSNNHISNLAYVTRKENNRHVVFHGRRKFHVDDIHFIRRSIREWGVPKSDVAKKYGVTSRHIDKILRGEIYGYV